MIRLYAKDLSLVSHLITDGIKIGFTRYGIGESINTGRPFPCKFCCKYNSEKKNVTTNLPALKAETIISVKHAVLHKKKNYCVTCKNQGHRTPDSNCLLRPLKGKQFRIGKIYKSEQIQTVCNHILT